MMFLRLLKQMRTAHEAGRLGKRRRRGMFIDDESLFDFAPFAIIEMLTISMIAKNRVWLRHGQ